MDDPGVPSRTDGSRTISVASWNIRSGRNGGLESACRAMDSMGVGIGVLQETKITNDIYTRSASGYAVVATNVSSARQGGVALIWKEDGGFEVEEATIAHPNVITFQLVTGEERFYVVGCYVPPSDLTTLEHITKAMERKPKGCKLLDIDKI